MQHWYFLLVFFCFALKMCCCLLIGFVQNLKQKSPWMNWKYLIGIYFHQIYINKYVIIIQQKQLKKQKKWRRNKEIFRECYIKMNKNKFIIIKITHECRCGKQVYEQWIYAFYFCFKKWYSKPMYMLMKSAHIQIM